MEFIGGQPSTYRTAEPVVMKPLGDVAVFLLPVVFADAVVSVQGDGNTTVRSTVENSPPIAAEVPIEYERKCGGSGVFWCEKKELDNVGIDGDDSRRDEVSVDEILDICLFFLAYCTALDERSDWTYCSLILVWCILMVGRYVLKFRCFRSFFFHVLVPTVFSKFFFDH